MVSLQKNRRRARRSSPPGQLLPPRLHRPQPALRSSPAPPPLLRQTRRPFRPVRSMGHLAVGSQIAAGLAGWGSAGCPLRAGGQCGGNAAPGPAKRGSSGLALHHRTRSWSLDLQESYQKRNRPWHRYRLWNYCERRRAACRWGAC